MSTMGERISECVKKSGLTKTAFGKTIGISQSSISQLCSGDSYPRNGTIKSICREFGVSEEWLRTGKGEMFVRQSPEDELTAAVDRLKIGQSAEFKRRLVIALSTLKEEHWLLLEEKLKEIIGAQEAAPTIEQEADAVAAAVHDQYIMEKKVEDESSASPSDTGHADAEQMA